MSLFGLIAVVITLDQWSKWLVKSSFNLYQSKPIIQDFFHLTYITNEGMALVFRCQEGNMFYWS